MATTTTLKGRMVLILLAALFFTPILIALLLNSRWVDWQAAPERAHGDLLQPVVPLGPFRLDDAGGRARSLEDLRGTWHIAMLRHSACDSACDGQLELMHNIRLAQDRRADEVGLLWITSEPVTAARVEQLRAQDPRWMVFDGASGAALAERFPLDGPGAFYIVDPDGNIMERFTLDTDLNGLRKDLDRLLTWTRREPDLE